MTKSLINTKPTPDWFAEELSTFLSDIQAEKVEDTCVHFFCIYDGADLINKNAIEQAMKEIEQAMLVQSTKNHLYCYAWIDHQAGQLRVSTKSDADIQQKFRSTIEYVKNITALIQPLYEGTDIEYNPQTWKTAVFVVKNQQ